MTILSSSVRRNFSALMVLQIGNYILTLVLIPYLSRTLGVQVYGDWLFVFSFIIALRLLVAFGLDLIAARDVVGCQGSMRQVSSLLSNIITIRILLWLTGAATLVALSCVVPRLGALRELLYPAIFIVLGDALFPIWLYQGLEHMGPVTKFRLSSRACILCLIVVVVREPGDVGLIPIVEASQALLWGSAAYLFAIKRFTLNFRQPTLARMYKISRESFHVFMSTLLLQCTTTLNVIMVGVFHPGEQVAYYAIAERVYSAVRGLLTPFIQALFPALAALYSSDPRSFKVAYDQWLRRLTLTLLLAGVGIGLLARVIVEVLTGSSASDGVYCLVIFACSLPFGVGGFLAPILIVCKRPEMLMRVTLLTAGLGVLLIGPLAHNMGAIGGVLNFFIAQVITATWLKRMAGEVTTRHTVGTMC